MRLINRDELKERERNNWSLAAEGWERRDALLKKGAAPVTKRMLEMVGITAGFELLDIASGTGEPAISAAKIVGDSGKVIGTDLVEEMLLIARKKAANEKLSNINFLCIDAEMLEYPAQSFDAVTIRWGLMFMPEPEACLTAAYKALRTNGKISLACWTSPVKNPFVSILTQILGKYMEVPVPSPGTPGIFAFADPDHIRSCMTSAGFSHISIEEISIDVFELADGREYWEAISDMAAPVMALVRQLDDAAKDAYIEEVIAMANTMKTGDTLRMPGVTWVATAEKI